MLMWLLLLKVRKNALKHIWLVLAFTALRDLAGHVSSHSHRVSRRTAPFIKSKPSLPSWLAQRPPLHHPPINLPRGPCCMAWCDFAVPLGSSPQDTFLPPLHYYSWFYCMRFLPPPKYKLESAYEEMYCSNIDTSKTLWKNVNLVCSCVDSGISRNRSFYWQYNVEQQKRHLGAFGIYSSGTDLLTSQRNKKRGNLFSIRGLHMITNLPV